MTINNKTELEARKTELLQVIASKKLELSGIEKTISNTAVESSKYENLIRDLQVKTETIKRIKEQVSEIDQKIQKEIDKENAEALRLKKIADEKMIDKHFNIVSKAYTDLIDSWNNLISIKPNDELIKVSSGTSMYGESWANRALNNIRNLSPLTLGDTVDSMRVKLKYDRNQALKRG